MERETLTARLTDAALPLYATALRADTEDVRRADLRRCAVVIGSEGKGVSEETLALCGQTLKIPMPGALRIPERRSGGLSGAVGDGAERTFHLKRERGRRIWRV